MAPMLDFDDQLSEDWISQPRSSDGAASPIQNVKSSAVQSRIPLPTKPAASSKPPSSVVSSSNRPSPRILHAKSKSELNIPLLRTADAKTNGRPRRPPSAARSVSSQPRRSSSAQSWTADGTVQHKGAEVRNAPNSGQMTPEWRRRLLKGEDTGDQKDLFSPIGLESVFKPPPAQRTSSVAQSPKRRNPTRPRRESSMVYPSSPPPYPSTRRRRATTKSTSPSPYRERHEHDHNQCLAKGGKCEGALRTPTPTKRQVRVRVPRQGSQGSVKEGNENMKRIQSGASILEHESISPVTIQDGRIDYQSIQKSVLQLRKKMEELGLPEQERPSSRSSENGVDYGTTQRRKALIPEVTITSLIDDSALESPAFRPKAGFINTKRGGYSSDDNFHRRALSPSSFQPETSMLEEKSDMLPRPTTPRRNERFTQSSPEKPRSGGSPLKLFGQHDTFTNNHLMRRLSQYVGYGDDLAPDTSEPPSPSPRRNAQSSPIVPLSHKASNFGVGALDEYPFPPTDSFLAEPLQDDDPSLPPVLPPTDPFSFRVPSGQPLDPKRRVSRTKAKRLSNTQSLQRQPRRPSLAEFRRSIGDVTETRNDGKRVLYSPNKDHHAKRRRTLLSSVGSDGASPEPPSMGLLIGKKRTDALPGERARNASPQVLASREILRPRSVSSDRRSSTSTMSSWLGAANSRQISEQIDGSGGVDQPTKMLAEDLASFAVNVVESLANGERKASVTTADFFKEANMIMKHLRGQVSSPGSQAPSRRTASGRASGDMSLVDQMSDIEELDEESIRSLRSLQKQRSLRSNVDSIRSVLRSLNSNANNRDRPTSKLDKYKESDEIGLALGASVRNLKITPEFAPEDEDLPETDAPHIRILDRAPDAGQQADDEVHTNVRTRSSTEVSVNRSIRTGSSGNSSRKYNIAPETVKDFLSDRVGRMVFDHSQSLWVRQRNTGDDRPGSSHMNSDGTEEDPLKSIPDLEDDDPPGIAPRRNASTSKRVSSTGTVINRSYPGTMSHNPHVSQSSQPSEPRSRPSSGHGAESSELSRFSKFGSSQPAPETRATSWGTVPTAKAQAAAAEPELPQVVEVGELEEQQIGEQAILEPAEPFEDLPAPPSAPDVQIQQHQPSFSSSLCHIPDHVLLSSSSNQQTPSYARPAAHSILSSEQTPVKRTRIASALARSKEKAQRHLSVVKQRYSDRPVSRIDEQDEDGFPSRHTPETSLMLITPKTNDNHAGKTLTVPPPPSGRHSSVAFHRSLRLEPLSDFTFHQADESLHLDIDYVQKRHGLATHDEIDSRFSLAVRDLVARLTDIEPYEPFWDYIRQLDMSKKKLITLHMLEDFCERIEDLDVSDNELGQVNGAPETLRVLNISHNYLTSMTAWGHLSNLHYLDVSGNQIDSLKAFSTLPHLRELRADGNRLTSLDGLKDLSGLLRLSLKDNLISDANLTECELPRMTDLDLSGNEVTALPGLVMVSSLQVLRVARNKLSSLSAEELPSSLMTLDLAENGLAELDVSSLAHLQMLDVDCNSLTRLAGLGQAKSLETLSWRDQCLRNEHSIEFHEASDVRHLALSGNKLDISELRTRFLNLNALEMASCGLEVLPSRFGRLMPNLRYLNLSHNAIKDIKPLIGIKRLQQLHLVENRIHRLRHTATVLEKIGCELTSVDLRVNPITLGFYPVPSTPANTARVRSDANALLQQSQALVNSEKQVIPVRQGALVAKQVLQSQDQERDSTYKARLDEGTALRRRVFELLVYNSCSVVSVINGLVVEEDTMEARDEAWQRLVELKVVRPNAVENGKE